MELNVGRFGVDKDVEVIMGHAEENGAQQLAVIITDKKDGGRVSVEFDERETAAIVEFFKEFYPF